MKLSRLSIGPKNQPSRSRFAAPSDAVEFEILCDSVGTIVFGWAAPSVLYTRLEGGLSAQMGQTYASRLGTLVAQNQLLSFFCDCGRLQHYDLLARSAFVRLVLSNRRKFTSLTMLTWAEGVSTALQALVETLGDPIEVLTDRDAFECRLLKVAPLARRKLEQEIWISVAPPDSGTRSER
jgi:hypothetical protein